MKKVFLSILLCLFFTSCQKKDEPSKDFKSTYEDWKSRKNSFVEYLDNKDQARVIFTGSKVSSIDNAGNKPTVSEGIGYGLLLSCANNDQELFDKFLRYYIEIANNYACTKSEKGVCVDRNYFLMPWIVNNEKKPFWYKTNDDDNFSVYSSGSATDADLQIAWALFLANKKTEDNKWNKTTFSTIFGNNSYKDILEYLGKEIIENDVTGNHLLSGNQWDDYGKEVFFPGYFTPQAFEILDNALNTNTFYLTKEQCLSYIMDFQKDHNSFLFPNIIYLNKKYPNQWSKSFGHDAIRFLLWTSPYKENNNYTMEILYKVLDNISQFIKNDTLPSDGIDAFSLKALGNYSSKQIALNAPLYLCAYFLKNESIAKMLENDLLSYDITKNQPSANDPPGDSSKYYNAAILLLTKAFLEDKFD